VSPDLAGCQVPGNPGNGWALLAFRASGDYWRSLAVSIAIFRLYVSASAAVL
jgi:hypothetical protein